MKFKKIQSLFLAAALVCSMCVSPVYADPSQSDLEGQKEDAQNELTDLQTELNTLIIKASAGDRADQYRTGDHTGRDGPRGGGSEKRRAV